MNENARKVKRRRRPTAEQRRQLVEAFKKREEPAGDFARRHGFAVSTLHRWVQTERSSQKGRVKLPAFQEIRLPVDGLGSWSGEVCLPDGTRVRWNGDAGLEGTERLVERLRQPC